MTDELVEWLRVQLDDDEQWARSAMGDTAGEWAEFGQPFPEIVLYDKSGRLTVGHMQHIALHDPARVLRDVEAKRRILARHRPVEVKAWKADPRREVVIYVECSACVDEDGDRRDWPCPDIRDLASIYVDRDGYREEWRP